MSRWVDYSHKYGVGYMLCDGSIGVYFNDASKAPPPGPATACAHGLLGWEIVLGTDLTSVEYTPRRKDKTVPGPTPHDPRR